MPSLQSLWKEGREGALSPLEQMRAWALREAQKDLGGEEAVNRQKIADRVTKVGGGHPSREAIRKFLDRVDEDPDWYPGKNYRIGIRWRASYCLCHGPSKGPPSFPNTCAPRNSLRIPGEPVSVR